MIHWFPVDFIFDKNYNEQKKELGLCFFRQTGDSSTVCPENTMPAMIGAVEQGCQIIELEPAFTAGVRFVRRYDRNHRLYQATMR